MHVKMITAGSALALMLGTAACSREATVERRNPTTTETAPVVDRAVELQRHRDQELSKLDDRVAALERTYEDKRAASPRGTSGAPTAELRHDTKSDLADVKEAVSNLRSTTADNWWDRHEKAMQTAIDDVEKDVRRFSGAKAIPAARKNTKVADGTGQTVSTAPFTSSRDKFVNDMRARIDAMDKMLDNVKATGPRKTELNDLHARVDKIGEDIDRLKTASAEDWWALSHARVSDYINRIEKSVGRLDDNKR